MNLFLILHIFATLWISCIFLLHTLLSQPIYALLCMVLLFFLTSALFLAFESEFIALILIIVYVGAIMILFLFVIMMFGGTKLGGDSTKPYNILVTLLFLWLSFLASKSLATSWAAFFSGKARILGNLIIPEHTNLVDIYEIGYIMYTPLKGSIIILSFILLIAMVGALYLSLNQGRVYKQKI